MKSYSWFYGALGTAVAALSIVKLISYGFEHGLSLPMGRMLKYFDKLLDFLFGWMEPPIKLALSFVARISSHNFLLLPHWRYVFIILWLCVVAFARAFWAEGNRKQAWLTLAWGSPIALASAVAAGTVPLGSTIGEPAAHAFSHVVTVFTDDRGVVYWIGLLPPLADFPLVAVFPVLGIGLFFFGLILFIVKKYPPAPKFLLLLLLSALIFVSAIIMAIGLGEVSYLILRGLQSETRHYLSPFPSQDIVLLCIFFMIIASFELFGGVIQQLERGRNAGLKNDTLMWAVRRSGDAQVGLYMLTAIAGAILFILINTAINFTGL